MALDFFLHKHNQVFHKDLVFFLKIKEEVLDKFKALKKQIKNVKDNKIKVLKIDCGNTSCEMSSNHFVINNASI
jgi:hypothetical protein